MKKTAIIILVALLIMVVGCNKEGASSTESDTGVKIIKPVKTQISTGEDYNNVEKLSLGEYQIDQTDVMVNIWEGNNVLIATVTDGQEYEEIHDPILVTHDRRTFLYGKESWSRSLNRIEIFENKIGNIEENVVWTDFPSPDVVKCTMFNNEIATLGETKKENGWYYGLYIEGEAVAGILVEEHLNFCIDEGIATDDDGNVYMLYYSSEPYTIEIYPVDMPVKVIPKAYCGIDDIIYGYGFANVIGSNESTYVIVTEQKEAILRNSIDNLKACIKPLNYKPTYKVIEEIPENFDEYRIGFGTDGLTFFVDCYLKYDEQYSYIYTYHLTREIEKNNLGLIIPDNEMKNFCDYSNVYESYSEVEKEIQNINQKLDKWEELHADDPKVADF